MDEEMIDCMTEAGLDTVEIRLRRAMEDALSRGDIGEADEIEGRIKSLDEINVCSEDIISKIHNAPPIYLEGYGARQARYGREKI